MTSFQFTFTRPVKLATLVLRLGISPPVPVSVSGDDPTDAASQVFTISPKQPLQTDTTYKIGMSDGGTDAAGATLKPINPMSVQTLASPAATVTPQDGVVTNDNRQPISITFSVPMDEKTVAAALSVLQDGRAMAGSLYWLDDQNLTFTAKYAYNIGAKITVKIGASARSTGGLALGATPVTSFTIAAPKARSYGGSIKTTRIPWTGGIASSTRPYHDSELYYLSLMNCTRTGGWVTGSGECSTATHHTLPAQGTFAFSDAIADAVSRPYAKALADTGTLTHNLYGTTTHGRLCQGGFCGASWGENIASPSNPGAGGMIAIETFFQSESPCRCAHYLNIMNRYFHRAGVGVWVSSGVTRVVIDFYG
jgi:hypothetical protein